MIREWARVKGGKAFHRSETCFGFTALIPRGGSDTTSGTFDTTMTHFRRKTEAITSENVPFVLTFCLRNPPRNNYFKVTGNLIYTRSTYLRFERKVNSDLEPATGEFLMTTGTTEPSNH